MSLRVESTVQILGTTPATALQVKDKTGWPFNHLGHFVFIIVNVFPLAINGFVAESLPGLMVAQHQLVRWHLLNVGSDAEYHAVHFHGLPFIVHTEENHRMGVYQLFPGNLTFGVKL